MQVTLSSSDQYFGGRRLATMDQLGSVGTYFPWGEDKGTTNPQNTWSFATYWRDYGGLDYANNRYYSNGYGRFMSPDPYQATATSPSDPRTPQSWNRYAYVQGDPVNYNDPTGQLICDPDYMIFCNGDGDGIVSGNCDPSQASCNSPCGVQTAALPGVGPCSYLPILAVFFQQQQLPQPTCLSFLTFQLNTFLTAQDPKLLAWDPQLAAQLVTVGQADNVDPRLMASIGTVESGHGAVFGGTNNPFGLRGASFLNFTSPLAAVNSEGITLKHLIGYGDTTVAKLYSGLPGISNGNSGFSQVPGYCQGQSSVAACQAAGVTVSGFLTSFVGVPNIGLTPGNPKNLAFPCP
jgi:RHS repeat-associated protein